MSASPFVLVSGLPRSGTSLLMAMLDAGGLPALTDHDRAPDGNNPRGYFELEAVKSTRRDASWLEAAPGHAVKVIYRLLWDLPLEPSYRILFLRRDLREVHASQEAMLARLGGVVPVPPFPQDEFIQMFDDEIQRCLAWVAEQPRMALLEVEHRRLIQDPTPVAAEIGAFLEIPLDRDAMVAAVDPALHRERWEDASPAAT